MSLVRVDPNDGATIAFANVVPKFGGNDLHNLNVVMAHNFAKSIQDHLDQIVQIWAKRQSNQFRHARFQPTETTLVRLEVFVGASGEKFQLHSDRCLLGENNSVLGLWDAVTGNLGYHLLVCTLGIPVIWVETGECSWVGENGKLASLLVWCDIKDFRCSINGLRFNVRVEINDLRVNVNDLRFEINNKGSGHGGIKVDALRFEINNKGSCHGYALL